MSGLKEFKVDNSSADYILKKFYENPGKFTSTLLRLYWDTEKQSDKYKKERDTLIDDVAILKANNDRLMRRNEKLEAYVCVLDQIKDWRKDMLEITPNNQQLIELGHLIDKLEKQKIYKGRE